MAARAAWLLLALRVEDAWAQVSVIAPHSLTEQFQATGGRIMGSTATFGAPFFGDRVLGRLVYGESGGNTHCTEADYHIDSEGAGEANRAHSSEASQDLIVVAMVDRGSCSFVHKVAVAAAKGAHAVVIVNHNVGEDLKNLIVGDDGYGDSIHVPSILITKEDGDKLKKELRKNNNNVVVELNWDIPTDEYVTVDLWMSSASRESLKFLKAFSPLREKLNEVVSFKPHMYVFGLDSKDPKVYSEICLNQDGNLCAEDPDASGAVTGKDVLLEDVRQLCIHKEYQVPVSQRPHLDSKAPDPIVYSKQYWSYIEKFGDKCPVVGREADHDVPPDQRFGKECSEKLMRHVGIDPVKISTCVERDQLQLLNNEKAHGAWSPRALRINGWRFTGTLDPDLVVRAICAGFIHVPDECDELLRPRDYHVTIVPRTKNGVQWSTFVGVLMVISTITLVGALLYKRHLKKDVRTALREEVMLEVQAQMGEYSKMGGT